MSEEGEVLFEKPLVVDDSGTIVDRYKRWMLAKKQQRSHLLCLEYSSNSVEDTFRLLVERQLRKPQALSPYMRILLALELKPALRKQAKERQQIGGRKKGSSNLAKANPVDVRSEIARMAGVSSGNVTKVKQILKRACPEVLEGLRRGEISIHRAHSWGSQPNGRQRELLDEWRDQKGILSTIDQLLSRHSRKPSEPPLELPHLAKILSANPATLDGVKVYIIKGNGRKLYLTRGLVKYLRALKPGPA